MNDRKSYVPPFEIGKVLGGGATGEVLESRGKELKAGDVVLSNFGWRGCFIASPNDLHLIRRAVQSLSVYLVVLGMTGMTAWAGLNFVDVKARDVLLNFRCRWCRRQCRRPTGKIARLHSHRFCRFHAED